jgi:F0F1-type ATP synthase delta subunit
MISHRLKTYAAALAVIAEETTPATEKAKTAQIISYFAKKKLTDKLPVILKEAGRIREKRGTMRSIVIESARPLSTEARKKITTPFGPKDRITESIRPELIAGVRITINGTQEYDGSLAYKVQKLFS